MIDLHLHTTASDGECSPPELVRRARAAGLTVISITDHDTTAGLEPAREAARAQSVELIAGIEISAVADGRDVHVLGYFVDTGAASLCRFLERQRDNRLRRVSEMGERLAALGCPVDIEPILAAARRGQTVGRPQVAAALVAAGHVHSRDEAFDRYLQQGAAGYVPRRGTSPAEVVAIIHEAGGVASLAHPGVTKRDHLIPPLAAAGLDALEASHGDHDAETEARYRALAQELGLLVTGGSDYHGDGGYRAAVLGSVSLPPGDLDALRRAADQRRAR